MSAGPPAQDWGAAAFSFLAAKLTKTNRHRTLLRAKPSKGGDAELRDYRDCIATSAEPPAQRPCWRIFFSEDTGDDVYTKAVSRAGWYLRSDLLQGSV